MLICENPLRADDPDGLEGMLMRSNALPIDIRCQTAHTNKPRVLLRVTGKCDSTMDCRRG